jgi:branched-chain amino acid transport system ATP-binding protein
MVAERVHRGDGRLWKDLIGRGRANTPVPRVEELLVELGLDEVADHPIESLSQGHGRLVELGRALVQDPLLVLLDEPSSGLDTREAVGFSEVLVKLRGSRRTAMLLVEHDLDFVRRVVERTYVLDFGRMIASGRVEEVMAEPVVRRAYLGEVV